ncbi:MAG: YceI family protein [Thermoflavifilum sp.]|nr:YceI family protein [Thermoflavifilum sp.]
MKRNYVKQSLIVIFTMLMLIALLLGIFKVRASAQSLFKASPKSYVEIKGTSTLHDWSMKSNDVRLSVIFTEDGEHQINGLNQLTLLIPVNSLKSTEGSMMDNKAYKALKAEKYPQISFKSTQAHVKKTGNSYQINATGNLTIAGVTRTVTVNAVCVINNDRQLTCSGEKAIDMTDYHVSPPTFMGLMKTGKEITIQFQVDLFSNDGISFNN